MHDIAAVEGIPEAVLRRALAESHPEASPGEVIMRAHDYATAVMTHPDWSYRDANGKPLRGPCGDIDCRYMSDPGGFDHAGPHSWEDGTTGWPHDYGRFCGCPECSA
jgi:hypothetical protein